MDVNTGRVTASAYGENNAGEFDRRPHDKDLYKWPLVFPISKLNDGVGTIWWHLKLLVGHHAHDGMSSSAIGW
jgi:hypothetical protein